MKQNFELQLPALLYFIKESCHENLHESLNELNSMSDDFRNFEECEMVEELVFFLKSFISKTRQHLAIEENHLFPLIQAGKKQSRSIDHLVDDHEKMKADLLKLRSMTGNYYLAYHGNGRSLNFFEKMVEMDRIILNHIQIENNVLFPMVMKYG
jgi:iron-sulfur cluster repair protein YtfE (RIC family)